MLKQKLLILLLIGAAFGTAGCSSDKVLVVAKTFGLVTAGAIEQGIPLIQGYILDGTLDPETGNKVLVELQRGKPQVDDFNIRISKYTKFDKNSRADIIQFTSDVAAFLQRANDNGVLHIKNPQKRAEVSIILTGVRGALLVVQSVIPPE